MAGWLDSSLGPSSPHASLPPTLQILPVKGSILPHGKQRIAVEFVSQQVQRYAAHNLVLDIPGVESNKLAVPIRAECAVPRITLQAPTLELGDVFIRHPYKTTLRLANQSKLPAKFEVAPQDHASTGLATFTVEPSSGGIPAMGEAEVEVTLATRTLGRVQLPVRVKVLGSKGRPLECVLDARSQGPELLFGPPGSEPESLSKAAAVNFDKVCAPVWLGVGWVMSGTGGRGLMLLGGLQVLVVRSCLWSIPHCLATHAHHPHPTSSLFPAGAGAGGARARAAGAQPVRHPR